MSKIIVFDKEARLALKKGVDTLAKAVKSTMGPKGRNVVIEKAFGLPHVTKDGITVAEEIYLKDPVENMGVQMVRQAASVTAKVAGDGTTASTLLAQSIIERGFDGLSEGRSSVEMSRGMTKALTSVVAKVRAQSKNIALGSNALKEVATISANNDPLLGELISKAVTKVGEDGYVLVGESRNVETTVEFINGINFDKGYMADSFINDTKKAVVQFKDPLILFVDDNIKSFQDFIPVIKACNSNGIKRPLVIIANDIIEQALNILVSNKINPQANLEVVAIKAPSFGDNRQNIMHDMAIATGAQFLSETTSFNLEQLGQLPQGELLSRLGKADSITVTKTNTIIVGGQGDTEQVELRLSQIKAQLETVSIQEYQDQMKERVAKLNGGVAIINVGGVTSMDMKERKDRVDDAVAATQAALEEGVVLGGGYTLANIYMEDAPIDEMTDEGYGEHCVIDSLVEPFLQIAENAGYSNNDALTDLESKSNKGLGYDALNDAWGDLVELGIIDPTKVVIEALVNAVSVAQTFITTNTVIVMDPEDKPQDVTNNFMGY